MQQGAAAIPILARLSRLDRFLPIWIIAAMVFGIFVGRKFPALQDLIDSIKIGQTSLPIALGLLLMMYPVLARVKYEEMSRVTRDRRLLGLSILFNWVIGPALMFSVAWIFLYHEPEFRTGLIVIGLARCIAMVLIWNDLAGGDREAGALLVAINSLFQIVAYSILGIFYLQILPGWLGLPSQDIQFSLWAITSAVLIFLGVPLLAGYLTRRVGLHRVGAQRYDNGFAKRLAPFALYGLLFTIVILFAQQGAAITTDPILVLRIAIPLLIYFVIMWGVALFAGAKAELGYEKSVALAFTAAGNNFELAIAVSIGVWGINSGQALAGTIGPLIEVPALIALVYLSLRLRKKWKLA